MGLSLILALIPPFLVLDVVALIGLAVLMLRPPVPDTVTWLRVGKVLLFLALGMAAVICLFFTCGIVAGDR
ncbi:MAG TPA: hypothetical protein VGP68_11220 [Gemmataceae bacterium]|jgi:hypothetical protein|nr:hypothetical protein [Gemmataceae bacterium]